MSINVLDHLLGVDSVKGVGFEGKILRYVEWKIDPALVRIGFMEREPLREDIRIQPPLEVHSP